MVDGRSVVGCGAVVDDGLLLVVGVTEVGAEALVDC